MRIVLSTNTEKQPHITGNHSEAGNWNPNIKPLMRVGTSEWTVTLELPVDYCFEYKFTLGTWEEEALTSEGLKPDNHILHVKGDTTIHHTVKRWSTVFEPTPFTFTGNVEVVEDFKSPQLANVRDLRIWLPPSYHTGKKRYPVLYMHDGQNIFAPLASLSGNEWHLDETATELISSGQMNEIIIVGVDNTSDRRYEYAPTYTGNSYSQFIAETVKPYIDLIYRTLPDSENTATAGASLGGLIAFHLGWEYGNVFSMAGCLSPAFLVDNSEMTNRVANNSAKIPETEFIIFNGTEGLDSDLLPDVKKMEELLFTMGVGVEVKIIEAGNHSESDWAKQSRELLLKFFGKD